MANPCSVVAHLVKLIVTIVCMKFFKDSFLFNATDHTWAVRALQIFLTHSALGIIRFGTSSTTKRFRNFYDWFSVLVEIAPFAFFTTEILLAYKIWEEGRLCLLALGLLPIVYEPTSTTRDRSKYRFYTDIIFALQALIMTIVCLKNGNFAILSLAASYIVARFISEDFCDRFEVPYIDLSQYSLCFVEVFAIATFKDIETLSR
ncbi:uncharacterized protein LOC122504436 [Leptopilina heterotoma]|uniref:uncharacterized protein LOC122504436 n=1 Tax=Leptopilina heterotoma TaxID=63436 RepID=UPI001CA9215D|nr:uncharacterized protein LOC122504436 [Leptopilina heterotoma]